MENTDKKCCGKCKYCHTQEAYWHDHYLIQKYSFCSFGTKYTDHEVELDHYCDNFEPFKKPKK